MPDKTQEPQQCDPRLDPEQLGKLLETLVQWNVAEAQLGDGFVFKFQPYTVVNAEDKRR